ncbi:low specificity L-threonine aldolase [Stenotrophomonas sp. WHRI 8082]|uniref:threonine aldolase family protein n=1 Tax=Stenotrophomonas sp. WHRI 8082 TaxID=3162571 RepID=UPI0032EFA8A3
MNFGSDNQSGVSPRILDALVRACSGTAAPYGTDMYTRQAEQKIAELFEHDVQVFFVATGTAANCLSLSALAQPWNSILCHAQAHLISDESTALEFFTGGARLLPIATDSGKITPAALRDTLQRLPDARPHSVRPSALTLTQATENGLVYTPGELQALTSLAHERGLHVHMDGARFANAVAYLGCTPAELSVKAGIDVLSFGASKDGALVAEAVVFFNTSLAQDFDLRLKRAGQLVSKGRLFGAQFSAWLQDGHWLELARAANDRASALATLLQSHPAVRMAWPVQVNEVFVVMPKTLLAHLHAAGVLCYDWYPDSLPTGFVLGEDELPVRFVTAWSTSSEELDAFAAALAG